MNNERRKFLTGAALTVTGSLKAAHAAGQENGETLKTKAGKTVRDRLAGNSLQPEGTLQEDKFVSAPGQIVANTQCMGCWTLCGLRTSIDVKNNRVLRATGNPYHPLSADRFFDYNLPIEKAQKLLAQETGMALRATACARGAALAEGLTSPYRITTPLKRVGKRGEGKWKSISFEELVSEVVNGGDLFGEGHVDGLKAIRDLETPVDKDNPEFGPAANQLLVTFAGPEGRQPLLKRFANNSFGTINFGSHGSYCGLSYRAGSGALMNDFEKNSHAKPDWDNAEYILFIGTSPAQAGNPFKRQARSLAERRTAENFRYDVVAPRLELTSSAATPENRWIPVTPGGDLALVLGMLRYIIDNKRYNEAYLTVPGPDAMKARGAVSYCNATHLFIADIRHPLYGQPLTEALLTGKAPGQEEKTPENAFIVKAKKGKLSAVREVTEAELFVDETVKLADGTAVRVKSAMSLLRESTHEKSLREFAELAGTTHNQIIELAKEFTSHGTRASAITHGGTMHSTGFYTAWAILLLNVMIGNMNKAGGMCMDGGKFRDFAPGPRYNLAGFKDMVKPKGTNLARNKRAYEASSEYRRRVEAGENPYPARAAWYPFVGGQLTEMITSALQGYPYPLKCWISHMTNPLYGITGFHAVRESERLKDPKVLPLFIACDAFMNETTALADYIVPDTHTYESWGFSTSWAGVPSKASTARWPVVESPNAKTATGETVCMETFIIAVAKAMGLPGFGENAITDNEKKPHPLNTPEDFFLRAAANVAFDGKAPVADALEEDCRLTGVNRLLPALRKTLRADEVLKAANVYAKGGRFAARESAWEGDNMAARWTRCLQIWNPVVARARHYHDGSPYHGCPRYYPAQFADRKPLESRYPRKDWPLRLMSFKSNVMNAATGMLLTLHAVKPQGIVALNRKDAGHYAVKSGDTVEITTPSGSARATVLVTDGVAAGTIAIEHGYGHKAMGAAAYEIDGRVVPANEMIARGININDLGLADTSKAVASPWVDWVCGSAVRQGIPAKITRLT